MEHQAKMPDIAAPIDMEPVDILRGNKSPFVTQRVDIYNNDSPHPHEKRTRQWIKARGKISDEGGHQAHLSALAYMSDSYFIGTVARTHRIWRHNSLTSSDKSKSPSQSIPAELFQKLKSMDLETLKRVEGMDDDMISQLKTLEVKDGVIKGLKDSTRPEIGMMVSLDHSIYFHDPKGFRADEWMCTECETPWAGDGRGYVTQRIFSKEGKLIASCVQEGVVRLKQEAKL